MGLEREAIGKEAGVRTAMLVSSGAAIFSMIGLTLPYLIAISPANLADIISHNGGYLGIIANIVVGIGFLGAGIIIKTEEHVRGLTTAAFIWTTAAVGTLVGIGLIKFGVVTAVIVAGLLYFLRNFNIKKSGAEDSATKILG